MNTVWSVLTRILDVLPYLLLLCGLYFGIRLRFFPFLHPVRVCRMLFARRQDGSSALRATCMALAGTVGVGNITGVAIALATGGAGAVFWMWICALAAMLLKYAEITLSMDARQQTHTGKVVGGTPYAMRRAGLRRMGSLFALLCLGYTLLVGGAVQANAVADCMADSFSLSPFTVGILLVLFTLPVIGGGGRRIAAMTAKLVPLMCALYIFSTLAIIWANRATLPSAIEQIFAGAFSPSAAAGGGLGFLSTQALRVGAARGLMSNEGGCGTSPMAHATSSERIPARQGLFGIVEVFVDTTVICTLSALALLCVFPTASTGVLGLSPMRMAFSTVFGSMAGALLSVLLFFFAYATILCQAFYGQVCVASITRIGWARHLFFVAFCGALLLGAIGDTSLVWEACDLLLGAMTVCNLILLLHERERILQLTKEGGLLPTKRKAGGHIDPLRPPKLRENDQLSQL